jgi:DNA-binding HxlR family transcriptional regulator
MKPRSINCGLDVSLTVLVGKWKPLILFHLSGKVLRFSQLRRSVVGISEKVLINELKELERDGIILRTDYSENPPRVDYRITEFGSTLAAALVPLCEWGDRNRSIVDKAPG